MQLCGIFCETNKVPVFLYVANVLFGFRSFVKAAGLTGVINWISMACKIKLTGPVIKNIQLCLPTLQFH